MYSNPHKAIAEAVISVWKHRPPGDTTISSKDVQTLLEERGHEVSAAELNTGLNYLEHTGCFEMMPAPNPGDDGARAINNINLDRLKRWIGR